MAHPRIGKMAAGVLCALVLLVAPACSGAAESDVGEPAQRSPLADLLRAEEGEEIRQAVDRLVDESVSEQVRRCMAVEGFEYWPEQHNDEQLLESLFDAGLTPRQSASLHGLGIADGLEYQLTHIRIPDLDASSDRNTIYRSGLSAAERDAYDRALRGESQSGPRPFETSPPPVGPGPPSSGGCIGNAVSQSGINVDVLEQALDELSRREAADPRSVDLDQAWAQCMASLGFIYANPDDMFRQLFAEFQPLFSEMADAYGRVSAGGQPGDGVVRGTDVELPPELRSRVDSFRDREIAQAVASFECDDPAARQEVRSDLERDFIEQHGPLLDALVGDA